MASFNKVILMGNLTREPELRYTGSGKPVCTIGLAVNKTYKTQSGELREEPCFVDVVVWGRQAEAVNNHLHKGSNVFIDGELKQESWTDRETGQNRYKHTVVANDVRFVGAPKNSGQQQTGSQAPNQPAYQQPAHTPGAPETTQYQQQPAGLPAQMPQS
ncbi:MAG: single-stranded DNA-binding protein [Endozoicomonas sp.]